MGFALSEAILIVLFQLLRMHSQTTRLIYVLARFKKKPDVFLRWSYWQALIASVSDVDVMAAIIVGSLFAEKQIYTVSQDCTDALEWDMNSKFTFLAHSFCILIQQIVVSFAQTLQGTTASRGNCVID